MRYSAAQALGQMAEDMKPQFQQEKCDLVLPVILNGIHDKEEKVAAHWFACLTNFCEDLIDATKIQEHLGIIFTVMEEKLSHASLSTKENCISTLGSLCSIAGLFTHETIKKPL